MTDPINDPSPDDKSIALSGIKRVAVPAGNVVATDPNTWYYLKGSYKDKQGNSASGYAYPLGINAATSFWEYVVWGYSPDGAGPLQFQPQAADDGWQFWKIHDDKANSGYHLDCKATGWLYRGSGYDTWFKIVDGKLHCSYWGGSAGSTFRGGLVPDSIYLGMALPEFTCELVKV